jgi:hypothetical protein
MPAVDDSGSICDFYNTACFIYEGQFQNDELNGFGRRISADGTNAMGWFTNQLLNGYGKKIYGHKIEK